jgi:hypothetical protein
VAPDPTDTEEGDTDVMVGTAFVMLIAVFADFVVSSVEVAVIVAVPAADDVKTPALLIVPVLDGLTDQVTEEL